MTEPHTDISHDDRLVVKRLVLIGKYDIFRSDERERVNGLEAELIVRGGVVAVLFHKFRLALLCGLHDAVRHRISEYGFGPVDHTITPFTVWYLMECSFPWSSYFILIRIPLFI